MSDYEPGDYQSGEDKKVSKLEHHNSTTKVNKENPLCIVFDFASEKAKREDQYKHLDMPVLMEVMTDFLQANPAPVVGKANLKKGIAIFESVYKKANTPELRKIAHDYIQMYHKDYVNC